MARLTEYAIQRTKVLRLLMGMRKELVRMLQAVLMKVLAVLDGMAAIRAVLPILVEVEVLPILVKCRTALLKLDKTLEQVMLYL